MHTSPQPWVEKEIKEYKHIVAQGRVRGGISIRNTVLSVELDILAIFCNFEDNQSCWG